MHSPSGRYLGYFYPRPPRGGRPLQGIYRQKGKRFLSTPSARRATPDPADQAEQGLDFYPRPPRGGRLLAGQLFTSHFQFLSTPSARRATFSRFPGWAMNFLFLSTPSARRATAKQAVLSGQEKISIHALREEGDYSHRAERRVRGYFYPRPPRGGRHLRPPPTRCNTPISIHALREEGDDLKSKLALAKEISIHALREEGDCSFEVLYKAYLISIHALREEGDGDRYVRFPGVL